MSRIAVYPGSFDPLTRGHLDIIQRASKIFDHVIVAVSNNASKRNTFSVSERIEMVEESIRNLPNVDCDTISGRERYSDGHGHLHRDGNARRDPHG